MIEKAFQSSRLIVLIAVAATTASALLLYISSIYILAGVGYDFLTGIPSNTDAGKNLAVTLLKMLDLLLIAITFHVLSVSLYRLFITPLKVESSTFLSVLNIKSFHDLKVALIQVSVVILIILFLEQAVEVGATLETLYFGIAIAAVVVAAIYAAEKIKE